MKCKSKIAVLLLTLVSCCVIPCRGAQTWGHVRGRFVWDGKVPSPSSFKVSGRTYSDDSLLVNSDNLGIANIAVYVLPMKQGAIPIHSSYAAGASKQVDVRIDDGRFSPLVAVVQTSQTLVIKNMDNVASNPVISTIRNSAANILLGPGDRARVTFKLPERQPIRIAGTVHPWLQGCLLVTDHPYATFTDANGEFKIANMPTGQWILQVWHKRAGFIKSVNLDGQAITWEKGKVKVHVQPGTRDMGEIRPSSELFKTR